MQAPRTALAGGAVGQDHSALAEQFAGDPGLANGGCHLHPTVGTAGPGASALAQKRSASVPVGVRDAAEQDRFLSAAIRVSCLHRARFALSPN